jgi:4-hydroxybutyrate CoA-transferase
VDWREEYKRKLISAEEAANLVKSGDRVAFTLGREPLAIGLAIAARKEELKGVKIVNLFPGYDFGWFDEGWQDSFEIIIAMITGTAQEAVDGRRVDIYLSGLTPASEITDSELGDVLATEVSPPDENGFCSFGNSLWSKKRQIQQAKLTIAEVNNNLIRTYGDNFVHISEIDYFVEHISSGAAPASSGSLAGRAAKEPEPYLKEITRNVASLIKDGDTIQIGVGRTTEPLVNLGLLDGKNDIGVHTEATPPGIIRLVKEGVVTGKYKTLNPGKCVATSIGGSSREEMGWVHMNPSFYLVDIGYLEDIRVIGAHDNFIAINNALLVDFSGQIGAESIGPHYLAGAGGQIPFAIGTWLSKGGRFISVIPSTAKGGTASRIVPLMPEGTKVTIQSTVADYVVTEYGIAHLKGKTLRERTEALISIAHPDFRTELWKQAKKLYWP